MVYVYIYYCSSQYTIWGDIYKGHVTIFISWRWVKNTSMRVKCHPQKDECNKLSIVYGHFPKIAKRFCSEVTLSKINFTIYLNIQLSRTTYGCCGDTYPKKYSVEGWVLHICKGEHKCKLKCGCVSAVVYNVTVKCDWYLKHFYFWSFMVRSPMY